MRPLIWGFGLFLFVWLVHLALWRIRRPRAGRRLLFLLFLGALAPGIMAATLAGTTEVGVVFSAPRGAAELALFAVLHTALSLAYLALYVALEGDSPTLTIAGLIAAAGPGGIAPDQLRRGAGFGRHLQSRLELMVVDGMAERSEDRYRITAKGRRLLGYYQLYGRLAGAPPRTV